MGLWDNAAFGTTSPAETADKPPNLWDKLFSGAMDKLYSLPQRAIQNSQYSLNTGNYDPSVPMETALTMTGGAGAMPAEANSLRMGIKAYHGSPHDFDAFDISKIGTGEGAQAYGHGLYFAENEGVAKSYRDSLSTSPSFWFHGDEKLTGARNNAAQFLSDNGFDKSKALAEIDSLKRFPTSDPSFLKDSAAEVMKLDPSKLEFRNPGKMYEVNINADPEHFLDWDKPLSQQPENIQKFLREKAAAIPPDAPGPRRGGKHIAMNRIEMDAPGSDIYRAIAQASVKPEDLRPGFDAYSPHNASATLQEAGIPGIKYLDQGSRPPRSLADTQQSIKYYSDILKNEPGNQFAADQLKQYHGDLAKYENGTRNYVVFDPKMIDIMRKYGIGGATPFAAGLGLTGQDNSQ